MKFFVLLFIVFIALSSNNLLSQKKEKTEDDKMSSGTFSGLQLRLIGPAITSGRISDVVVNPKNKSEFYVAVASGNLFKTINNGITFTPIFDNHGSYSMGCVAIDPSNTNIVWLGTGENNSQRSVGWGDGIYKSTDGGKSWENMGLKKSEHIGKIIIDPDNSDIVYVAAQGPLWGPGGDRGLYKTVDGGKTWTASLAISENTGVSDIVVDPEDKNTLYCSAYQRRRHVWTLINGGPESAIYKSTDAGANWVKINKGLPSVDLGRIGLAISPMNRNVVYAIVEAAQEQGGFYKSTDRGATWNKQSSYVSTSPQYYQEIVCDPVQFDLIYSLDTYTQVSEDGGKTWKRLGLKERHVDDHALYIDPTNNNYMIIGGDGGLYETYDKGETWRFFENLPVTQYYRVQADNSEPFYYVYGGTQDNNSLAGPSRTTHEYGILNQDWFFVVGGDGYEPQIDPTDPNLVYGQWQYGNLIRFDRKSGEITGIQPQPEKDEELRFNWDTPLILSPHSHTRLYFAANKVYRSDDRGNSWTKISEDITRQIPRDELSVMGKVWMPEAVAKNQSTSLFGNTISLVESPVREGMLLVGTDDGLIQMTENNGTNWTKFDKFPGVPETTYVSDLLASQHNENVIYATFNNHKNADFRPYILKSNDKGKSWSSISGNLPEHGPVWTIEEDHVNPDLLFAGTEFGLFFTIDGGKKWVALKGKFPTIAVRDLDIQERESDLVVGTFGRGIYILDDYTPLRRISKDFLEKEAAIFPVKDALMYIPESAKSRRNEGETFFRAENPPYGAIFTYYMKEAPKTKQQVRLDSAKKLTEEKKTLPYPTWTELRAEDEEEAPYLIFTIMNSNKEVVRQLKETPKAGLNRISWDLRYPSPYPVSATTNPNTHSGMPVLPGKYYVSMSKVVDGKIIPITEAVEFICKPLNHVTLPAENREKLVEFQNRVVRLQAAVEASNRTMKDMNERIKLMKISYKNTPGASSDILGRLITLESKMSDINIKLNGNQTISKRAGNQKLDIASRIGYIVFTTWYTSSTPTVTNEQSYSIAADGLTSVINELKLIKEGELQSLENELDRLNAPWTPGRFPIFRNN